MKDIFTKIVNQGHWKSDRTVCGHGSTMTYTANLRENLLPLLEKYQIKSMFDAPCGDYFWMSQTVLPAQMKYIGGDIVENLITENKEKFPDIEFCVFDITKDPLPEVDLFFCRDCLIHFSNADIRLVLDNIARSSVKYVLMTSYDHADNRDIRTGDFRGVDFMNDPYGFEPPVETIKDWIHGFSPRSMCLWSKQNIVDFINK